MTDFKVQEIIDRWFKREKNYHASIKLRKYLNFYTVIFKSIIIVYCACWFVNYWLKLSVSKDNPVDRRRVATKGTKTPPRRSAHHTNRRHRRSPVACCLWLPLERGTKNLTLTSPYLKNQQCIIFLQVRGLCEKKFKRS